MKALCCDTSIKIWRDKIIHSWRSIKAIGIYSQDLLWPLFIAATEACDCRDLQTALAADINEVIKLSGHWNGLGVLKFLQRLWQKWPDDLVDWIDYAGEWTQQGSGLFII